MKRILILLVPVLFLFAAPQTSLAGPPQEDHISGMHHESGETDNIAGMNAHPDHHAELPAGWSVIPFALLLLMIATGPLFFEHFWHKAYPFIAVLLALLVVVYYLFVLGDTGGPIHAIVEYIQFIALLSSLYIASGGILIKVDKAGKPMTNVMLLLIGAVVANVIGTTGASMLLIRPFIRLNKNRIKAYHIIFFIFMVSNVGGSLTPIGDPPLFLGFLKGVPFHWTITHNLMPWVFANLVLAAVFFTYDKRNKSDYDGPEHAVSYSGKTSILGGMNFIWLAIVIGAVFIDPNVIYDQTPGDIIPAIPVEIHGNVMQVSYIREIIMFSVAFLSYYFAKPEALKGNEFDFEPIKEVAFIFIGIFGTMAPALALVGDFAQNNPDLITVNSLYWGTGALSGVLDNAPTYVNFLTAALSSHGGDINQLAQVKAFANETGMFAGKTPSTALELTAISIASVFFGAMTYIGNGPNFMVKAIAEQSGIKMPSFFSYIGKYSLIILLPILLVVWLLFFVLGGAQFFIDLFHV